ncbi:AAA family ATPase [Maribellus maritimus]|uniref:AAA family ATPase n=1 Tax=Maribellus maritimus TaxID=2870838 RepID=UPI001EEC0B4E|nr:ATP-binding protein [Maribellus maritimus]MCG6189397.1 ATP-binding protein [Maribellus maritimus]
MPKIIVITGAESTGKSVLTESLAKHFGVPFIPEIAREYVENIDRKYNYNDVETIAKKQVELLHQFSNSDYPFLFVDTWLIITKIWLEVVFKKVPEWIENEIQKTKIDLFLVCDTDLPWIPDPVRENGGKNRKILQKTYLEQIEYYNFSYKVVSGHDEKRLKKALHFLKFM